MPPILPVTYLSQMNTQGVCGKCGLEPWSECWCSQLARVHDVVIKFRAFTSIRLSKPEDSEPVSLEVQRLLDITDPNREPVR